MDLLKCNACSQTKHRSEFRKSRLEVIRFSYKLWKSIARKLHNSGFHDLALILIEEDIIEFINIHDIHKVTSLKDILVKLPKDPSDISDFSKYTVIRRGFIRHFNKKNHEES